MTVRVVVDSSSDLPRQVLLAHGITVVPAYINMDGESYLDGVQLSRQEFYERLPHCKTPPTTSAPGPGAFAEIYSRLLGQDREGKVRSASRSSSLPKPTAGSWDRTPAVCSPSTSRGL